MNNKLPILYIVIPCYNEEQILPLTGEQLKNKTDKLINSGVISDKSKIVFVNDGSTDRTWELITVMHNQYHVFTGIDLSRNKGHQNALLAGLMYAKDHCDISVSMDADLQDDINVIDDMVEKYMNGYDIVYGVRSSRKKDSFFKKTTAEGFYKIMDLMGIEIVFNHADCRLMSKRALDALNGYKEINLFLRGIIPQLGFKSTVSYYERKKRSLGESKYPLKKMLSLAIDGITSFSVKPLRFITLIGCIILILSIISEIAAILLKISPLMIISAMGMISGIQTLCIGIIGEYIGKIYAESKHRPRYIIREILK